MRRTVLCIAALAVMAASAFAADLPLTRVVLFSSGVGYFERSGTVEGDATVELSFRTAQINDILKSLVLQDFDGGDIAPVTYAPQDPLQRTLSSFSIDLSEIDRMSDLWDNLIGAKVRVTTEKVFEGTVVGSEEQEKSVGDRVIEFEVFNLMTEEGLVQIPLWHVNIIQILDEDIDKDIRRALEAIDEARDVNKRPVSLAFNGEGKRNVRVGYLLETPVWKTTYRLVADEEGLYLQGWAIVENTTDDDWDKIGLSMVSGRPVSFIQDLYEPLYVRRPVVAPSVQVAARPQTWEGGMEDEEAMAEMAMPAEAPAPARAKARRARKAAPTMAAGMAMADVGGMGAPGAPPPGFGRDAAARSMAQGGKVGTLFQYAINQPVTIPRQRSAMIPIINAEVEGEKLSVYNQFADAKHPMNGIQMKNTSGLHLMGGPITVFADNVYGGDALIEDVAPGDKRLLTYAMDLAVEIDPKTKPYPDQILGVKIVRGVMTITSKSRMDTTYTVKNNGTDKRVVLVEHPIRNGWDLISPKDPAETTRSAYRFRVEVEPKKAQKLVVTTEMKRPDTIALSGSSAGQMLILIKTPGVSDAVKKALQKVADMQGELADLEAQREEKETRIEEIEEEQNRIRKNMRELDRQSELYKQYVSKFTEQETEFEQLREGVKELRGKEDAQQKAIEDYIAGINVE